MNNQQLIEQSRRLMAKAQQDRFMTGTQAEICEFLKTYAGPNSHFLAAVQIYDASRTDVGLVTANIASVLEAFIDYLQEGLSVGVSPERRAQLDVVSDYLGMADTLLKDNRVHPAAPAVIIGATLEEFLRTWVEAEGLPLGQSKPGIETYSLILRDAGLINKQDGKDITAWAGVRNHAAHGEWEEVGTYSRVQLMLEGVNLFMRKYTP